MKIPNELYVIVDGEGNDEFLNAQSDAGMFAVAGETIKATLFRKVCDVQINAPLSIIQVGTKKK